MDNELTLTTCSRCGSRYSMEAEKDQCPHCGVAPSSPRVRSGGGATGAATIYAFTYNLRAAQPWEHRNIGPGVGWIKVGYTTRAVKQRVREQTRTVVPNFDDVSILLETPATNRYGQPFTDRDVHRVLVARGFPRDGEWFGARPEDVLEALDEVAGLRRDTRLRCPRCGYVTAARAGEVHLCPRCQVRLRVPRDTNSRSRGASSPRPAQGATSGAGGTSSGATPTGSEDSLGGGCACGCLVFLVFILMEAARSAAEALMSLF